MKKLILVFVFFLLLHCSFNNCNAQWVQCNVIYGGTVLSLTASGNYIYAGTESNGLYYSDDGTFWAQTYLNDQTVYSLSTLGNYIFVGTNEGVFFSSNHFIIFFQTLSNNTIYSLASNGDNVFAGTDYYGIYRSTNYGSNWTQTAFNGYQGVYSLATLGNNIFAGTDYYGIYRSTNYGGNWTQIADYLGIYSLATLGNNIFAGTDYYGIYLSTNNGANWTQIGLNNHEIYSLVTSGNNIFAGTESGIYLSTNNGANWTQKNEGFSVIPQVHALLIANNYFYAGTNQSVWRRPLSELVGIHNIGTEVPESYSLSQNYPNPFNPSTKIKFEIKDSRFTILKIYDILGKEIETLVNEKLSPGTYEVNWNASQYPSGVYFYRVDANGFSDMKKMILMK